MHLFRRLLSAWPNKADILLKKASIDIPPVYRGKVWSAILGVLPFHEDRRYEMFYELDTLSEHISDRQLQVDIPRCHQYDEMVGC
jgi:TBC domain-containing protein kinase-like protein